MQIAIDVLHTMLEEYREKHGENEIYLVLESLIDTKIDQIQREIAWRKLVSRRDELNRKLDENARAMHELRKLR